ncbi:MAG: AraC family transcriptional regulator [Eubacteriales bacterium]|nr:AraC family transcriptional regulator [Eubacteriales bacterium]
MVIKAGGIQKNGNRIPDKELAHTKHALRKVFTITNLVSIDYIEGIHMTVDPHFHNDVWELAYVGAGKASVRKGDKLVEVMPSQFVLIGPGIIHELLLNNPNSRVFIICFTINGDDNIFPFADEIFTIDNFQKNLFSRMISETCSAYETDPRFDRIKIMDFKPSKKDPFGAEQILSCCLEMILLYSLRSLTMQGEEVVRGEGFSQAVRDYLVQSVIGYIEENAGARLTVNDIAAHFNYSRTYLSTLFCDTTGKTLKQTITDATLRKAKKELLESSDTIGDIAVSLGFDSAQYFSHWFRKNSGMTPSAFYQSEKLF